MATAKIKVSELAKSLGMTNAEMLELCKANNVAAKTPQSTLVEAFVPMLKRKAEAAGLVREVAPVEEEKPAKKAPAKKAAEPVEEAPAVVEAPVVKVDVAPVPVVEAPAPVVEAPVAQAPVAPVVEVPVVETPAVVASLFVRTCRTLLLPKRCW